MKRTSKQWFAFLITIVGVNYVSSMNISLNSIGSPDVPLEVLFTRDTLSQQNTPQSPLSPINSPKVLQFKFDDENLKSVPTSPRDCEVVVALNNEHEKIILKKKTGAAPQAIVVPRTRVNSKTQEALSTSLRMTTVTAFTPITKIAKADEKKLTIAPQSEVVVKKSSYETSECNDLRLMLDYFKREKIIGSEMYATLIQMPQDPSKNSNLYHLHAYLKEEGVTPYLDPKYWGIALRKELQAMSDRDLLSEIHMEKEIDKNGKLVEKSVFSPRSKKQVQEYLEANNDAMKIITWFYSKLKDQEHENKKVNNDKKIGVNLIKPSHNDRKIKVFLEDLTEKPLEESLFDLKSPRSKEFLTLEDKIKQFFDKMLQADTLPRKIELITSNEARLARFVEAGIRCNIEPDLDTFLDCCSKGLDSLDTVDDEFFKDAVEMLYNFIEAFLLEEDL